MLPSLYFIAKAAAILVLLALALWAARPRRRLPLAAGSVAPGFALPDDSGRTVRLSDFRGRCAVILVFYPGDDTPTCTRQLCALRDAWDSLEARGIAVLGINGWSARRHRRFREHRALPFPLLVDANGAVQRAYHARLPGMAQRTVYGIDREGRIAFARRGRPEVAEILAALQ